jgi:hypothetical protein
LEKAKEILVTLAKDLKAFFFGPSLEKHPRHDFIHSKVARKPRWAQDLDESVEYHQSFY